MQITNLRPGVYSAYDVSSTYAVPRSKQYAAVVAKAVGAEANLPKTFASYAAARELFEKDDKMLGAIKILFDCGVSKVIAVPVGEEGYTPAMREVADLEHIGAVLCDCEEQEDRAELLQTVQSASRDRRERIGFCGVNQPEAAANAARTLAAERIVLCSSPAAPTGLELAPDAFFTCAAVAGIILSAGHPAYNFNAHPLPCLTNLNRLPEEIVQELLAAGVTLAEPVGAGNQLIRALTTRTVTAGMEDRSLSEVNTILCIDDIMQSTRAELEGLLRGSRITRQSLGAILTQVMIVLAAKQEDGVIESFAAPKVYPHDVDPAVCVVELSFKIAHVVSQIHVMTHIQI